MTKLQRVLVEEVQAYSKAQGFDLVLADGVIYFANSLDITPAILGSLTGRKAPAPAASKPAK
jgi:Skp family chaperone for outer membrane proteins